MMKLLIPIVLALVGAGAGIGAGLYLKPLPAEELPAGEGIAEGNPCGDPAAMQDDKGEKTADSKDADAADDDESREFVKLNNQFVVPVMEEGRIVSLVVLSLSIETLPGGNEVVFAREPKLRDSFLQVLFDHANSGGFSGAFTGGERLQNLRASLRSAARLAIGETALDVLVTDIARQDV